MNTAVFLPTDPRLHPDEWTKFDPGRAADGSKGYIGVTRLLREATLIGDPIQVSESILDRGSAVHEACHRWLIGRPVRLRKDFRPFLRAFQVFAHDTALVKVCSEKLLIDEQWRISGHVDLIARLNRAKREQTVIELKTGRPWGWTRFQLAAYAWLFAQRNAPALRRIALWLRGDGTYDVTCEYRRADMMDDILTVQGAARLAAAKLKYKL